MSDFPSAEICLCAGLSKAAAIALMSTSIFLSLPSYGFAQSLGIAEIEGDLKAATDDPRYAKIGDPRAKLQAYWKDHPRSKAPTKQKLLATGAAAAGNANLSSAEASVAPPKVAMQPANAPVSSVRFLLRQSFTDVSIVSAPNPNATAAGAGISYSDDMAAHNTNFTAQAAVIGGYSLDFGPGSTLRAISFGPYYTIDKSSNSSAKLATQNKDNETAGGLIEVGLEHTSDYYDWFRGKSGVVDDYVKGTSTFSSSLEWIPVYLPYLIHAPRFVNVPWGQAGFRFDPELVLQYDEATSSSNILLFSNRTRSLRVGPQFGLYVLPFPDVTYLSRLLFNVTYHPWYETYSGKSQYWIQANATYNLDDAGIMGLTFTYQNGADENTGKQANVYKISLTSKLDYCTGSCPEKTGSQ